MITVQSISKYDKAYPTAITIGTFDGVHVGHRKILERLIDNAAVLGLKSAVLTFFPHPRMVLQQDVSIQLLNTVEEKERIMKDLGLDYLIVHPFTKKFSRLSATEFVEDVLVGDLNVKKIIIGYDHRFGRNRNADINDLRAFGKEFHFEVEEISAQEVDDVSVSSTKIRKALEEGDIQTANTFLGYKYMLSGTIVRGKGLGKKLDFPTANLSIPETYKLIPKDGVYVVSSLINGITVYGMMNIGFNPTFEGEMRTIETNFFDFDQNIYGQYLQIDIIDRIRDEYKFGSVEILKAQLRKDREVSLSIISR